MPKKSKLSTPAWILEGFNSEAEYNKKKRIKNKPKAKAGEEFYVKVCPQCRSKDVNVVIGEVGAWECKKCNWKGRSIEEEAVLEEEYFKIIERMEGK